MKLFTMIKLYYIKLFVDEVVSYFGVFDVKRFYHRNEPNIEYFWILLSYYKSWNCLM